MIYPRISLVEEPSIQPGYRSDRDEAGIFCRIRHRIVINQMWVINYYATATNVIHHHIALSYIVPAHSIEAVSEELVFSRLSNKFHSVRT